MDGLEHEMAAAGERGRLRASHADREHVIDTLRAAYVYGLVTKDEFDARVSQTLASRTHAELALVTADLPAGLAVAQQRAMPAPARGSAPAGANVGRGDRAILATAVFAVLALVISVSADPFASLAAFLLLQGGGRERFRVVVPTRKPAARRTARQALRRSAASAASNSQRSGSRSQGAICCPGRTAPVQQQAQTAEQR
jgi:hypothetical protein